MFVSTGIVYLICVNNRQVYAGATPVAEDGYDVSVAENKNTGHEKENGSILSGNGLDGAWSQESENSEGSVRDQASGSGSDGILNGSPDSTRTQQQDSGADGTRASQPEDEAGGSAIRQTGDEMTEEGGTSLGDEMPQPGTDSAEDGQTGREDVNGQDGSGETVVSYMTVEDDYFADALFIGDSRTVGMSEYGDLEDIASFYASTGLSVHKLFTAKIVSVGGQKKKITVEEALQENAFSKIYFMLGINEMGTGTVDTFMEKYGEAVARLQELQPDALIYLQGIMKVTTARSEKGDYITNEGIEERNERIAQLADNRKIFYLDVNPVICDEAGGMEESYTHDGVHLKARYIEIWKQFLKEHAIAE